MTAPHAASVAIVLDPDALASLIRNAVREELKHVQPPDGAGRLLTAREAAAHLGISENALRIKSSRGLVPCLRLGRLVRYRLADLEGAFE